MKNPCTMRTGKQQQPGRAAVPSPSLEVFKAQLGRAQSSPSEPTAGPAVNRGLD